TSWDTSVNGSACASASLSAKLYSVPGFNTGKGGIGIIEGGGVAISVRWIGTGGGTGCTAIETEWCGEQPAITESISNALDCTAPISNLLASHATCRPWVWQSPDRGLESVFSPSCRRPSAESYDVGASWIRRG
ncbi:MAG TPA: hypothetical protein VLA85_20210, partial [Verrucomicrobiae bacterium]|nr:hypothetical protein [Verrucomicrobiae bacterium]